MESYFRRRIINNLIISKKGRSGNVLGFINEEGDEALYVDSGVNLEIKYLKNS